MNDAKRSGDGGAGRERSSTAQELVLHDADGEEIAPAIQRPLSGSLFGRQIVWRSEDDPSARARRLFRHALLKLGDAKV